MVTVKKIRITRKGKYNMNRIALANSKSELKRWRRKNRHKYKQIFYGSPRKDKKGYYALVQTY